MRQNYKWHWPTVTKCLAELKTIMDGALSDALPKIFVTLSIILTILTLRAINAFETVDAVTLSQVTRTMT